MDLVISVLLIIAVQFIAFVVLRGRIQRELNATNLLKDVQDEVDGMVRELNLSAERNIALLEARIEELEGLLSQADQKMVLMGRELERRERTAEVYTKLKKTIELVETVEPAEPVVEPEPATTPDLVAEVASAPVPTPAQLELEVAPPVRLSLTQRVLGFRDQGLDPGAIAAATGATRGEVELILSLNPLSPTG